MVVQTMIPYSNIEKKNVTPCMLDEKTMPVKKKRQNNDGSIKKDERSNRGCIGI